MADSDLRSSALVPRSVTLEAATSAITSSRLEAVERTAPVHVASPIVRKRTVSVLGVSFSVGDTKSLTASYVLALYGVSKQIGWTGLW